MESNNIADSNELILSSGSFTGEEKDGAINSGVGSGSTLIPDIVLHQQKVGAECALLESSGSSEKWDTERAIARSKTAKNQPRGYSINIFEGSK